MPGYPCCNNQNPNCGECQGTAPLQYQLTVPEDVFYGGENPGGSCEESCEDFNGVFLLDYNPELLPLTVEDVSCIWESPSFDACYVCLPPNPDLGTPETCYETGWRWRIELTDEVSSDGKVRAYVFLYALTLEYVYMWIGEFTGDCSAQINLTWEPVFMQNPGPGCHVDQSEVLSLEAAS